ncbi:conserved hypothetical protein [Xenorhabdus szentirmaii DSM 16338]|uniref:Phage portal protein n=1 Tax=Xenorhabdus szentirmaii DSM 16338 TaxID=1427518 RepID=W1ITR1_9GAMM|nr:hypothetical protein [Xenorhabdus szentirmaii]PHM30528.1 hypothetical protein Xsze_04118 [Xenorhabdus szentirmaii DSM 16338]CDL80986.1 conserved hypothetical protein [Xenorhabdus szentirmaii DSM 16338]
MDNENLDGKKLKELVERRHPEYEGRIEHWNFLASTYAGGRKWFADNIFRYFKEGDTEFKERLERAYRFNHTREVVNLINKYIFRENISREREDAPDSVKNFWDRATREQMTIDELMVSIDIQTSVFGRIWVVVDSTMKNIDVSSVADEKKTDARAYAYWMPPQQMLDFAYDDDGNMLWALTHELVRDDADPFNSSGKQQNRYRLWTQNDWYLFKETKKGSGKQTQISIENSGEHNLGVVPVFPVDCMGNAESRYFSPSLIDDIAYLDRAVANYLSNLDAIIQDQTFSQLAIPVQSMLPGDDDHKKVLEFGTKRVFTYDAEGGAQPFYMSPDPKQASMIIQTVQTVINEIYHSVGVAGERTKQDNAKGIDNSSGAAKAYDFQRVNSLLITKAERLQRAERQMLYLAAKWMGQEKSQEEIDQLVSYPESFDVRGLMDEFDVAKQLKEIEAPDSVRRHQMEILIDKIFPNVSKTMKSAFESDLREFPLKNAQLTLESK